MAKINTAAIKKFREDGVSDAKILLEISKRDTRENKALYETAFKQGATAKQILTDIVNKAEGKTSLLSFIGKDIAGVARETEKPGGIKGFVADIARTTFGSKGFGALPQLFGRILGRTGQQAAAEDIQQTADSLLRLTQTAANKFNEMPEGPEKVKMRNIIQENLAKVRELGGVVSEEIDKPIPTQKEVAGSTLKTAVSAVMLIAGKDPFTSKTLGIQNKKALDIANFFTGKPASFTKAFQRGAVFTALSSVADEITEGADTLDAIKSSVFPAFVGGSFFAGSYLIGSGLENLLKSKPVELFKKSLKQASKDLQKEIAGRAPELSRQLIDLGISGSDAQIYSESAVAVNSFERQLTDVMKTEGKKIIKTQDIADALDDTIAQHINVLGEEGADSILRMKDNILAKGEEITFNDALKLKRDIYKLLPQKAFNVGGTLSDKAESLRIIAGEISREMAKKSDKIAAIMDFQQTFLRTAQALEIKLVKEGRANIIGLTDSIIAAGGLATGKIDAVLSTVAKKTLESASLVRGVALKLDFLGKLPEKIAAKLPEKLVTLLENLPVDEAGNVARTAIINMLGEL